MKKPTVSPDEKRLFLALKKQFRRRIKNEMKVWLEQNHEEIEDVKRLMDVPLTDEVIYQCSRTNVHYNYLYYFYDPTRFE